MKRALLLGLLALAALSVAAQDSDAGKQSLLERALGAMAYVPSFKQGLLAEKQGSGKTSKFIEATLAADDKQLEAIIARIYARYLSRQQVEELVRFYESDAGKALTAQQAREPMDPHPQVRLNPTHAAEARAFTNSATGRAFARISNSEEIWGEISKAIRVALVK